MAERHRHHYHDDQMTAQRHLRPAADEMALHAIDPVNAGIDPFQGTATVGAALPGGAPHGVGVKILRSVSRSGICAIRPLAPALHPQMWWQAPRPAQSNP